MKMFIHYSFNQLIIIIVTGRDGEDTTLVAEGKNKCEEKLLVVLMKAKNCFALYGYCSYVQNFH